MLNKYISPTERRGEAHAETMGIMIRTPNPLDIALGSRIKLRRRELGLSQEQLAKQVGVTFQQVQKYERGTNRVSFSRLIDIAQALDCGASDIIGELDRAKSPTQVACHVARLSELGASELLKAYTAIASRKHRRAILNLAKQLAEGNPAPLYETGEETVQGSMGS